MKTGKVQVVIKDVCKITENILENNSYKTLITDRFIFELLTFQKMAY